ncbi:hypothetical protein [Hymenobacter ruricola]|uniref:Uncharacterized protein n=1 Tax=Hymenobacter ruricola TaxID=2791023 RepID=A0ABS0I2B3_9BACT|nr:hypothetical protein [Hymenobacter ruricola]MBF9221074.1 hypothetical protein [Hymenobacter ruricola]
MRHICTVSLLLLGFAAKGQTIALPDGEYMDTTSTRHSPCAKAIMTRYYNVAGKYPRSSETLRQAAQAFLARQHRAYQGSGYVTFRFIIDCQARRLPRVQVLQTDAAYQRYHFHPELVSELYGFLKTLTEWRVAKGASGQLVNYYAYLSFKITDGKVVAVIP